MFVWERGYVSEGVVKALAVRQPWAWLIVHGWKDVENRTWATDYRGPLLIHASKTFDTAGYQWVRSRFPAVPMPSRFGFQRGGIVGRVNLVDCVEEHASPWFFGPVGFVMADATVLPFREIRGQLGIFDVPEVPHGR